MSSSLLDPRRRAFADAIGRAIADQVWAEITRGNPAAQNGTAPPAFAGEAEAVPRTYERDPIRARTVAHQ